MTLSHLLIYWPLPAKTDLFDFLPDKTSKRLSSGSGDKTYVADERETITSPQIVTLPEQTARICTTTHKREQSNLSEIIYLATLAKRVAFNDKTWLIQNSND